MPISPPLKHLRRRLLRVAVGPRGDPVRPAHTFARRVEVMLVGGATCR